MLQVDSSKVNFKELSGLQLMQALVEGHLPHPPWTQTIPMKAIEVVSGLMKFEVYADERHTNALGGVYGGFAAAVMDFVTGCTAHTKLEAGVGYTIINLDIKLVRPVPLNEKLIAQGRVLNVSKSLIVSEGIIKNGRQRLIAHGSSTCAILK